MGRRGGARARRAALLPLAFALRAYCNGKKGAVNNKARRIASLRMARALHDCSAHPSVTTGRLWQARHVQLLLVQFNAGKEASGGPAMLRALDGSTLCWATIFQFGQGCPVNVSPCNERVPLFMF